MSFQIIGSLAKFIQLDIDEVHKHAGIPRLTIFELLVNLKNMGYVLIKKELQ